MVERESPFGTAFRPGTYGNLSDGTGLTLSEVAPAGIAEVAAWPGRKSALAELIGSVMSLDLSDRPNAGAFGPAGAAFSIGPQRFLVAGSAELFARLSEAISMDIGTVTDLSHGRTAIRAKGTRAEWVLAKLFAIDFHPAAFPVGEGRATAHHDIAAQIQRTDADQFNIYIPRSFARAFWRILCDAAEEIGYEVSNA